MGYFKNSVQRVSLKLLPGPMRDLLATHFFDMPACTGKYDKYSDITYGTSNYLSEEELDYRLRILESAKRNRNIDIMERNLGIIPALAIASERRKKSLCVLDIGGGMGNEYFMSRNALGEGFFKNWTIVEVKPVVDHLKLNFQDSILKFEDSIPKLEGNFDVVVISGTLQYLPDPLQTLQDVSQIGAECIFIQRTPYWEKANRLTKQLSWKHQKGMHKGRLSYPFWILNESNMYNILINKNYSKALDYPGQQFYVTKYGFVKYRALLFTLPGETAV